MSAAIGIDLGTTNSCVAIFENDQVQMIPNKEQYLITPSFVFYSDEGTIVGNEAKTLSIIQPTNAIYDFKRIIGRKFDDGYIQKFRRVFE